MDQIYDFLKESKTFYLATIEDNKPRIRPFGEVLYFTEGTATIYGFGTEPEIIKL